MSETPSTVDPKPLLQFIEGQAKEYGGKLEIDGGLWALFVVAAKDAEANALAKTALADARFVHHSGLTEDDQWMLYYVDTAARPEALHWFEYLHATLAGDLRPASPAQRVMIRDVCESNMPHRVAQQLCDMHGRGELSAGVINDPKIVRTLLDRLHIQEPLFFAAFHQLLEHHLIDMTVLLQQMMSEDIGLGNSIVKGSLSRDPFLQKRQDAAAGIRKVLMKFFIINPLDQQKNAGLANPYAAFMDISVSGGEIVAQIDGTKVNVPLASFLSAIQAMRQKLYRGAQFGSFNTQAPWVSEGIAYGFRFIKQRLEIRRDVAPIDGLYMLTRAVDAPA